MGDGIVDASKRAADISGVNAETVRKWTAHYYLSLVNVDPSVIAVIETILASSRGKSIKKPYSLIKNEEFCVSARKFVRCT